MPEEIAKTTEGGIERVREILFGEILLELERRLAKLENYIAARSTDVQHDARQRMDVLEAHLKKEVEAIAARTARDNTGITDEIRQLRHDQHDASSQLEQRVVRSEERLEAQIGRVEREGREQLLSNAKRFFEELVQLRTQLSMSAAHEEEDTEQLRGDGSDHGTLGSH
jgi:hypothetical protein